MDSQAHENEVCRWEPPSNPRHSLIAMPTELIFNIIDLALAVGQESDVSALARTNKAMHFIVNSELYRLVIKHKIFHIVNWAAQQNRLDTLKIALAHGGNPNQMRISANIPRFDKDSFRPVGWNLLVGPSLRLDRAVRRQNWEYRNWGVSGVPAVWWSHVWFSSASLSIVNRPQVYRLSNHYLSLQNTHSPNDGEELLKPNDARLVQLSKPLDENFAFPEDMSPADMDRREVKIGFLRLFRYWDSPLHLAALHDRSSVTKALLANGADKDCTSIGLCNCGRCKMPTSVTVAPSGNHLAAYTPLHVAICMGKFRAAKVLVAHGAERMAMMFTGNDKRDWLSENPLHRALSTRAAHGFNYNFIEFLLDHGYSARIEERNHESLTPLLIALDRIGDPAQVGVVMLLLRYGADPNNPGPCSPASVYHGRPLTQGGGGGEWATPALWATREGNFRLARLLLDHGADAMARSSGLGETMLFAACTLTDDVVPGHNMPDKWQRMELLDAILASCTKQDLNRFHTVDDRTPLTKLIHFKIFQDPNSHAGEWERKVFGAGDIMAGVDMGKETPFETMITEVLQFWFLGPMMHPQESVETGDRILVILQASGINQHRYRPRAILNQLWGYVDRAYRSDTTLHNATPDIEIVPYMLLAFIKAGFSPAEVDRHGDTAMTSFLQQLLKTPDWASRDSVTLCHQGWVVPMIMALLQEHGAALDKRNDKGYTAFDYLDQILNYDGRDEALVMLRRAMRRSVQPGLHVHGHRCFQFHHMILFGGLSGDTTLERIHGNESVWMPCVHFCGRYCGGSSGNQINQLCPLRRHPLATVADCDGQCCYPSFASSNVL